ncbi:MAG: hypothetical protein GSR81_02820 [Desulfurococcales archaeon]|nr:hypothetical protein [Desulfurococcales archaeon]
MITAKYILSSQSLLQTILLLHDYLEYKREQGWSDNCITYRGLRSHLYYNYRKKPKPEWHTVERTLRKLAEEKLLRRIELKKKKRVLFCLTPELKGLIREVQQLRQEIILEGARR